MLLDSRSLDIINYVFVETPPLVCQFKKSTKVSGRQFLDEVQGPMDARIVRGTGDELWISFYAERNLPQSDDIVRGIHAAPLHVEWRACSNKPTEEWQLEPTRGAVWGAECQWLGIGDGQGAVQCRAACDGTVDCNAVSFRLGTCVLRHCPAGASAVSLGGWETWRRTMMTGWHRIQHSCVWLEIGSGRDVLECQRNCESTSSCNAILFSDAHSSCFFQHCGSSDGTRPVPPGWQAFHFGLGGAEQECLARAWVEAAELVGFPVGDGVEKNWNLIRVDQNRIFIEYHVEPHIVLEAHLDRSRGIDIGYLGTFSVSRWPFEVLHGVSNVRGGFCCMELPERLWRGRLHGGEVASALPGPRGGLPLDGPLLLGCGHLQRIRTPFDQAPGDLRRFRRQAKSRTYHQFFYAIRPTEPFYVIAVSPEWCIAVNGHFSGPWRSQLAEGEEMCEAIQFASGLALRNDRELVVSYGINDCEADLMVVPLARLFAMLRPVQSHVNASLDDIDMI